MIKNILILDTNVLLTEPQALYKYPNAIVVIPQTVLKELDKIKMIRTDKTLQFNGRQVSRNLFSISAAGDLQKGVELENGSIIKVADFNTDNIPKNLNVKLKDDQILALANQFKEDNKDKEVTIVTNDLNMLIKAQSLDIKIMHHSGLSKGSKVKRFFSNQIATIKKNPIMAVFLALILGGIIAIIVVLSSVFEAPIKGPPDLVARVQLFEAKEKQYLKLLDKDSNDQKALFGLAELYIEMGHYYKDSENYNKALDLLEQNQKGKKRNFRVEAFISRLHFYLSLNDVAFSEINKIVKAKSDKSFEALNEQANKAHKYQEYTLAITYFKKAIIIKPKDINTRLDLANAYYENKQTDQTIKELHKALAVDDKHAIIYYNLGLVYWQSKKDANTATGYFEKYLELQPEGDIAKQAKSHIETLKKSIK